MKVVGAFLVAFALLAFPARSSALPLCGGSAVDVTTYNADGGCVVDGLVFSDFLVVDAGSETVLVNAVSSAVVGDVVYFQFNPNLATSGATEDIHFFFKVATLDGSPTIIGVDLYNGGVGNTSISEQLCSSAWVLATCGFIGGGTRIGDGLAAASGQSDVDFFSGISSAYVFKDIFTGPATANWFEGEITSFTQSFHVTPIPEPASLMLIGSGLLGLAARRRAVAKKALVSR